MTLDLAEGATTPSSPAVQFDVALRGYDRAQVERYVGELSQQVVVLRQALAEAEATTRAVRAEAAYAAVVARNQVLAEVDALRDQALAEVESIREQALMEKAELLADARRIAIALAEAGRGTNEARRTESEAFRRRTEQAAKKAAAEIVAVARAELAELQEQIETTRAEFAAHQQKVPDLVAAHRAVLEQHGRMYADLQDLQTTLDSLAPPATALPGQQIVMFTSPAQRAPGALPAADGGNAGLEGAFRP
jgi:DivIVA domain-containing protein